MSELQLLTDKPSVKRMLWFIGVLTVAMTVSFMASVVMLYLFEIPAGNKETLVYMLGQLSGLTTACVMFWVGTTHSSGQKTDLLAKAQPVKE
ncbi:MAG: hypothetical protein OEY77_00130 [Nitrospira sp.]|nr:hypothetical protein [Nitrospira sp.]